METTIIRDTFQRAVKQAAVSVTFVKIEASNSKRYLILSKDDALLMTNKIIKKYRPALEALAK
jgi:hypothetical protein